MMNHDGKRPVTIEDLIRLKQAERPKPEFWVQFDAELRAKQLAALVEKKPWWRSLPTAFGGLARYHLPLGAAAVLAITLVTLREQGPAPAPRTEVPVVAEPLVAPEVAEVRESVTAAPVVETFERVSVAAAAPVPEPAPVHLSSEANVPGELARMVPLLSADTASPSQAELAPSARSIALNRAVAEAMLGTVTSGFEARALPTRITPTEPLARMENPAETRRSRFASAFASTTNVSQVESARVARRLSDEELYDTINRFGARGDRVSFRF